MKNIAIINSSNAFSSTGKIAVCLFNNLVKKGYNVHFYYGRGIKNENPFHHMIESKYEVYLHGFLSRITGLQGSFSKIATAKMCKSLRDNKIDTIIAICMHGYYLNEWALYNFIANNNINVIFTMIDEYQYLGACSTEPPCTRFIDGKGKCPNIRKYPKSCFFDSCPYIMRHKEKYYKKMANALFVGPEFLVNNARRSYLGSFMKTIVLDEAIDLDMYRPQETSDIKERHNIKEDAIVVLCVAPSNHFHRGADYFISAAKHFADKEDYVFIHIGYKYTDKSSLPSNFIPISYIEKDEDVAKYYSMADILINPSMADAMSNTCLEALACGTPIACFNMTGMPYLLDESVGILMPPKDVNGIIEVIGKTRKKTETMISTCRSYALKRYDNKKWADAIEKIAKEGTLD